MVSRYIRGATLSVGQVFLSWETSIILMGQKAILGMKGAATRRDAGTPRSTVGGIKGIR